MINYDKVKTLIDRFDPEAHAAQMAMMQQQQGERTVTWQRVCECAAPAVVGMLAPCRQALF
jgi:hypothetical protein